LELDTRTIGARIPRTICGRTGIDNLIGSIAEGKISRPFTVARAKAMPYPKLVDSRGAVLVARQGLDDEARP
jgi:hypothetical protein